MNKKMDNIYNLQEMEDCIKCWELMFIIEDSKADDFYKYIAKTLFEYKLEYGEFLSALYTFELLDYKRLIKELKRR